MTAMHFQPDRTIGRGVLQLRLEPWKAHAACRTVDPKDAARIFFPEAGAKSTLHLRYCDNCPVKAECLEAGLALIGKEQVGIWGGLTHNQLERERKKRRGPKEPKPYHGNRTKPIEHGTMKGYRQHRDRHIELCDACRAVIEQARREQHEQRELAISGQLGWHARKIEMQRRIDLERTRRLRESA